MSWGVNGGERMKIEPTHPTEFLIREWHWTPYKAQLFIGERVTEEKAIALEREAGWNRYMWLRLQEQYDTDIEEDLEWSQ